MSYMEDEEYIGNAIPYNDEDGTYTVDDTRDIGSGLPITVGMADDPNVMRPCPFCGGSASTSQYCDKYGNFQNDWFISCDTCLAGFMEPTDTKQESIEKWNSRA